MIAIEEQTDITGIIYCWKVDTKTGLVLPVFVNPHTNLPSWKKHNFTPNLYKYHKAMQDSGDGSPPDTTFNYVGISTRFTDFTTGDGDLSAVSGGALELERKAPTITRTNNAIFLTTTFLSGEANTAFSAIASKTSSTIYVLNDASGFNIGDMLRCQPTGVIKPEYRQITNIATNTVTINRAFSSDASASDVFYQILHGIILSYAGTSTENTGYAASLCGFKTTKTNSENLIISHRITFR